MNDLMHPANPRSPLSPLNPIHPLNPLNPLNADTVTEAPAKVPAEQFYTPSDVLVGILGALIIGFILGRLF